MEPPHMDLVKKLHQRFLNTGSVINEANNEHFEVNSSSIETNHHSSSNDNITDPFGIETEEQLNQQMVVGIQETAAATKNSSPRAVTF
jgi:hypothetical protein